MEPDVMSVEEFLATGIKLLDNDVEERVKKASLRGNVLRYVCVIEGSRYPFHSLSLTFIYILFNALCIGINLCAILSTKDVEQVDGIK